jgi:hypothetical protein
LRKLKTRRDVFMKWWKKLLIAVGILAVIGAGLLGYGVMKVGDIYKEKILPDMQAYVQMTDEEQDQYVLSHMEDLMKSLRAEDEAVQLELEAIQNFPEAREAGLEVGRSMCAVLLSASDEITANLSAAEKAQYEKEAKDLDARSKHFEKMVEQYKALR